MTTFDYTFSRADGQEVTAELKVLAAGYAGSYWNPPEPMELEVARAYDSNTGAPVTLTDEEDAAAVEWGLENPPEPDYSDDDYG